MLLTSPSRRTSLAIAVAILLLPGLAVGAMVELRDEATVSGTHIRLRDVARVEAIDVESLRQLEGVVLGPAPVAGRTTVLDAATIRARLRALGVNVADIEFNGRSRVVVHSEAPAAEGPARPFVGGGPVRDWQVTRAEEVLEEALRRYLGTNAPDIGEIGINIDVPPANAAAIIAARATGFEFRPVEPVATTREWLGERDLAIRFLDRTQQVVVLKARTRIEPWPFVLAARHSLETGQVVRAEDLEYRQVASAEGHYTDPREVLERETRRSIRAGRLLRRDDVRSVPLVRRNDVITLVSRSGAISVASYAKSKDEGGLGDSVRVVTLDGRQTIVARVTGFHEAEISTTGTVPQPPSVPGRLDPAAIPIAGTAPAPIQQVGGQLETNGGSVVPASVIGGVRFENDPQRTPATATPRSRASNGETPTSQPRVVSNPRQPLRLAPTTTSRPTAPPETRR